jgi:membrane-associated protease RseP (regulator of RpoE activity)
MKSRRCILACVALVMGSTVSAAGTSDAKPVVMSTYKVTPRGWHVQPLLMYLFWGPVCTASVKQVSHDSVAGRAGLKEGDQILRINGRPVRGMKAEEMDRLLSPNLSATVELEVKSSGAKAARNVVLQFPMPGLRDS